MLASGGPACGAFNDGPFGEPHANVWAIGSLQIFQGELMAAVGESVDACGACCGVLVGDEFPL